MKKLAIISQVLIIATLLMSSCTKNQPYMKGGKTITADRNIDTNYSGLSVEGAFDIQLVEDQDYDIRIVCPENKLQYITTSVSNGMLYVIEKNNRVSTNTQVIVYVNKSQLNFLRNDGSGNFNGQLANTDELSIENYGSGNFNLSGFKVNNTVVVNNGSGDFFLDGQSNSLYIDNEGSGNINAFDLATQNANIRIDGSGNANVNVAENLSVSISGSGNVVYIGSPQLQVNISGSGTVHPY